MAKRALVLMAALGLLAAVCLPASAAKVAVFDGKAKDSELTPWGGGSITVGTGPKFKSKDSLEIKTKGYYEGGRLVIAKPVDLAPYLTAAKKSFLTAKVQIGKAAAPAGMPRPGGGMPMPGGMPGIPGMPGGMPGLPAMPGGMPGLPGMGMLPEGGTEVAAAQDMTYAQLPGLPQMPGGMPGAMPGMPGGMPGMPGGQGAMPGGMPGMMPGGMPGMMPGGMPGMMPGGMPGMMPGGMPGMMPGGMPGMMPGGMEPGMMPGGMPGGMMAPGGPMPGGGMGGMMGPGGMMPGAAAIKVEPLEAVRVVLLTDKGQLDAGAFVVEDLKQEDGWGAIKVAFSDMKGPGAAQGAKLTGIVFTGNSEGSFYVANVELTSG